MRLDRDGLDRAGLDRTGYFNPFSSPAIFSTGAFEILVNRTHVLDINATGAITDPLLDRTHLLDFAATGEMDLLLDRGISLAWGATGIFDTPLLNRTHILDFSAIGGFDDPGIKRIIDLAFSGTGSLSLDPILRLISLNFSGTGAYPITYEHCVARFSTVMLDRGSVDRGSEISVCGPVYPIRVDRTFIFDINATGTTDLLWTWLKDLSWGATGAIPDPLVNRTIPLSFGATGAFTVSSFIPIHYLTADWGSTGSFSMGTARSFLVNFGATGHVDTPTAFIPIHYLNQTWGSTGAFVEPWVYRAITNIDKLIVSGKISRSLADKMYSAVFTFDKTTVAGLYSSLFWTKLVFKIPDYTGTTFNTVFVGTAPSSSTNFTSVRYPSLVTGDQELKAYDYSYYLTAQYLDDQDLVLLKWADQQLYKEYQLHYKNATRFPAIGNRVIGGTSGDSGTIVSTEWGSVRFNMKSIAGSAPYFQDSEALKVAGVQWAQADGTAVDVTGAITRVYPDDLIYRILGGTNWQKVTGINPYNIMGTSSIWGSSLPEIEFDFTTTTTKAEAIEQICKYMKWIFYVRWNTVGGVADTPSAYFINETNIDTQLDLPAPVYVTSTTDFNSSDARKHLISPFKLTQAGENQYNWIEVRCQSLDGTWFQSVQYASDVYDATYNPTGTKPKRMYYEENKNLATQSDCDARALDLYTYYQKQVTTWSATFRLRSDFRLLQKLLISGYDPAIADGTYRIIGVDYDYSNGGTKNEVTVTIVLDSDFKAYLNLKRVYLNSVFEIQNIVQDMLNKALVNQTGVVTIASTNNIATVELLIGGTYGSVTKTVYDPTNALVSGNKVYVTMDQTGRLIAIKTA